MKAVLVLFCVCMTLVSAKYMTSDAKFADDDFLVKQQAIFEILMNVWQPGKIYEQAIFMRALTQKMFQKSITHFGR